MKIEAAEIETDNIAPVTADQIINAQHAELAAIYERDAKAQEAARGSAQASATVTLEKETGPLAYIGSAGRSLMERFLGAHEKEFLNMEAHDRELHVCEAQYRSYTETIREKKQQLEILTAEVQSFLGTNIVETLVKNRERVGSIENLFGGQNGPLILAAFVLNQSVPGTAKNVGQKMIEYAEGEHAALIREFADFKHEQRGVLKELGLL